MVQTRGLLIIGDDEIANLTKKLDLVIVVCRLGGFVAFVVYMTTLYGLYVPDWNFLEHDGDTSQRYTVYNIKIVYLDAYSRFELYLNP